MATGYYNEDDTWCCVMSQFLRDNGVKFDYIKINGVAFDDKNEKVAHIDLPVNVIWNIFSDEFSDFWTSQINTYKQLRNSILPEYRVTETQE